MGSAAIHLHGGPLDGAVRSAPTGPDGTPVELADFDREAAGVRWYVQYRRTGHDEDGWHFQATGVDQRADED